MVNWNRISDHFQTADPLLFSLIQKPIVLTISQTPFADLVESVVSQQLSVKAADTIYHRLMTIAGSIEPRTIIELDDASMRAAGLSRSKVSYIKNIALANINFKELYELSDEDVIATLTKIKGIGRWTAEMFCMFSLARADVFSFGDAGLKRAIYNIYKTDNLQQMIQISNEWKPFRTYAARLLWASLA